MSEQESEATTQSRASGRVKQKPNKFQIDESEPKAETKRKSQKSKKKATNKRQGERKVQMNQERKRLKREQEKERKRREKEAEQTGLRFVANDDEGEAFYEVAGYLASRNNGGRKEVLVRWKGCPDSDNTWEPLHNLCDTAFADAKKFLREEKAREEQRIRDEKALLGDNDAGSSNPEVLVAEAEPVEQEVEVAPTTEIEQTDDHWEWNDREQVVFQEVERINVHDDDARKRVTEARVNGTPVVLVGHVGWANFAKRWLKIPPKEEVEAAPEHCLNPRVPDPEPNRIEAPQEQTLEALSVVCLDESGNSPMLPNGIAPVSEGSPSDSEIPPMHPNDTVAVPEGSRSSVENPQAQPDGVAPEPGPNGIAEPQAMITEAVTETDPNCRLDEWLDLSKPYELNVPRMIEDIGAEDVPIARPHYNETNPTPKKLRVATFLENCWPGSTKEGKAPKQLYLHQWQFPLSDTAARKLCHQSNPLPNDILGDDLLKYWLDLPQCKSDSPLQYIFMGKEKTMSKLHRDAGGLAISIAPIVGEKECVLVHRNDGMSCLYHLDAKLDKPIDLHSYPLMAQARIWKTTVRPGEILLMPQGTYHQCRNVTPCLSYSRFHLDTVNLLPFLQSMIDGDAPEIDHDWVLWNATEELGNKLDRVTEESKKRIKAGQPPLPLLEDTIKLVDTLRALRNIVREIARKIAVLNAVKGNGSDVAAENRAQASSGQEKKNGDSGKPRWWSTDGKKEHDWDLLVYDVDCSLHHFRYRHLGKAPPFRGVRRHKAKTDGILETRLDRFPKVSTADFPLSDVSNITTDDTVQIRFHGKKVKGKVLDVKPNMQSAYVSFEDFPSLYDEFVPYDRLRKPVSGGPALEVREDEVKPGLVVIHLEERGDQYRGRVQSTTCEKMFRIRLQGVGKERWMPKDAILCVEGAKQESRVQVSPTEVDAPTVPQLDSTLSGCNASGTPPSGTRSKAVDAEFDVSCTQLSGVGSRVVDTDSVPSPSRKAAKVARMSVRK